MTSKTAVKGMAFVAAALLALAPCGATADQVKLNVALAKPFLMAGQKQTTHLKVALTGFVLEKKEQRTPVNVAIVIDKSGSMNGAKIQKAKEAARMAVDRLTGRDIVSVVAFNHTVEVLLPATKVSEKAKIQSAIGRLSAGGRTALFAGVSKGAQEVRKFLDKTRVNRIILLSDGLANVGPSSPAQLGALGSSLIKEGISVTTIGLGLGYNEDLMTQLARRSDGNHAFVKEPADLAKVFKYEFGDVLSVVAQEIEVKILCGEGIRPIRLLGRQGDVVGQEATTALNQLYSEQEKYVLLELEVPATPEGDAVDVATVTVSYLNMQTKTSDTLESTVAVRFTKSEKAIEEKMNKDVAVAAVEQVANDNNRRAVELRDKGKIAEARKVLVDNAGFLKLNNETLKSKTLTRLEDVNNDDAKNLDAAKWAERRKMMRREQHRTDAQQAW